MIIVNNFMEANISSMTGRKHLVKYILFLISFVSVVKGNVIVNTNSGHIEGIEVKSILKNEKYYSFMGIPYARPPVGKLRFMPPEPHPGWTETLDAKKEKKPCAQFNLPIRHIKNYGFCGDEDCLHLSIHTPNPSKDAASLPVIVFLYNELFKVSYNASRDYGPDFFMKEDVIVVTVHHRIGSLGFLSFEDDLLPGNNGLRDVILALKWLKNNVDNFGGDALKVTLMGNHDGAGIADILLHSPKAKGLFNKVILQSGTSWNVMYFGEKPRERAIEFSKVLEQEAKTSSFLLKRLADVDIIKLTESEHLAIDADEARAIQRGVFAFGPVIEHDHPEAVITKLPDVNPIDIDIPVMIGYNSREAIEMAERYLTGPNYLTFADRDFLMIFPIRSNYHFKIHQNIYYHAIKEIKKFYFDEEYIKISKPGEYISYLGDIMSFYPIDYTVRKYTNESKSDVYYYMFDYNGELNLRKRMILENALSTDGTWGATIGDELCYLFVCNKIRKTYKKLLEDEESEEIKVLTNMVRMWTNFAKYGNPTPPGEDFTWKPATKENKECLVISEELQMKTKLHDANVNFWDKFLAKYRELAVDGVIQDIKEEL